MPDRGHSAKGGFNPAGPASPHTPHTRTQAADHASAAATARTSAAAAPRATPSEEEERRKKEEEKEEEEEEGGRRKEEEEMPRPPLPHPRLFPSHRLVHRRPGPFTTAALRRPLGMPYCRRCITSSCGSSSGRVAVVVVVGVIGVVVTLLYICGWI